MKTVFIGGPGRSGTSVFTRCLGYHPEVCSLPDVELKIFTEKDGLLDLYHTLALEYSPNRARVALSQFENLTKSLINGNLGQNALDRFLPRERWISLFDHFINRITEFGHPIPLTDEYFFKLSNKLAIDLFRAISECTNNNYDNVTFLEKTPHVLLSSKFIAKIFPNTVFIHVIRDPRSIAYSLNRMSWGPDGLEACCSWVDSYFRSWDNSEIQNMSPNDRMIQIRIEDLVVNRSEWSAYFCGLLKLSLRDDLFSSANVGELFGLTNRIGIKDVELLNLRLSKLAEYLGYSRGNIGVLSYNNAVR